MNTSNAASQLSSNPALAQIGRPHSAELIAVRGSPGPAADMFFDVRVTGDNGQADFIGVKNAWGYSDEIDYHADRPGSPVGINFAAGKIRFFMKLEPVFTDCAGNFY